MKNKFPKKNYKNISSYYDDYILSLNQSLDIVNRENLEKITNLIDKSIRLNSNIFICGNGGSSSVSNH